MYDLFMTGFLNDVDFDMAKAILSGYCWGQPVHRLYRVVYYCTNNPNQPRGLFNRTKVKGIAPSPDPFSFGLPNPDPVHNQAQTFVDPEWLHLNEILKKQSYILTARYEVSKTIDFGSLDPSDQASFNNRPGALFWSEIPDPASVAAGQPMVMQRKKIELWDQLNLPAILNDNEQYPRSETIKETYDIYHRENPVEFHLVRYYKIPTDGTSYTGPFSPLPAFDSLQKADPAGKWMIFATVRVLDDQSPEKVNQARDLLFKIKAELEPCGFSFKAIDRKFYDTQLAAPKKPTTQTLGMTQSLAGISGGAR